MNPGLSACKADALPLSYTPFTKCIGRWPRYGAVVGLDEAEAARVPAEGHAGRVALGRRPGVALRAARAAGLLGRAAGHVLRAVAARALVLALDEADLGALDEAVAVLDGRDVAEEVLAAVVGLDEAEAALALPAEGHARLLLAGGAAAAAAAAAGAAARAGARAAAAALARAGAGAGPGTGFAHFLARRP